MQTFATADHVDKLGDPEWLGAIVAGVAGSTAVILKGYDRMRGRRREELDISGALVDQAKAVAEMTLGMQSPLRAELDAVRAELVAATERYRVDLAEMRTAIDTLSAENAHLRSEVTLLRAGEFDRRHDDG